MTTRAGRPGAARVILLGLDGFPLGALSPERTPTLWRLGAGGGRLAPPLGVAALPATTYPGFTSLLTGLEPVDHRIRTTGPRPDAVPGWAGELLLPVTAPTILDVAAEAGRRVVAVMGDHLLWWVIRASVADDAGSWPPGGHVPHDALRDAHGYPTNDAVGSHLLAAVADPSTDLVFGHLNEADTLGHDLGPAAPATLAAVAATDELVTRLVEALRPDWDRSVLVVVSDHDMDGRSREAPIGLEATPGLVDLLDGVAPDGGAAILRPRGSGSPEALADAVLGVPGVATTWVERDGMVVAGADPGRIFAGSKPHEAGEHGGPSTARTLAIVAGGHPAVTILRNAVEEAPPRLSSWAGRLAAVLEVSMPRIHDRTRNRRVALGRG